MSQFVFKHRDFFKYRLLEFLLLRAENLGGATQQIEGSVFGKKPLVKNSSFRIESRRGRSSGFSLKSFCISFAAARVILEGIAYSLFRILMYVSFKQLVSKGGRPTSNVYLEKRTSGSQSP